MKNAASNQFNNYCKRNYYKLSNIHKKNYQDKREREKFEKKTNTNGRSLVSEELRKREKYIS